MTIAEEDEDLDSLHEEDEFDEQQQLSTEELNQQLAAAVEKNDVLLLSESLEKGADPSFRDEKHWNPLLWAAFYGHHEVRSCVGFQLRQPPDRQLLQIVQRLVDVGAGEEYKTLPDDMMEPATEVEHEGAQPRRQVNSPLLWAAYKVRITIASGVLAQYNRFQNVQGHVKVVWLLLNAQLSTTDVDTYGNTALHLAAAGGRPDIVRSLLHAGVDLNARNYHGNVALDLATEPTVRALLQRAMRQTACAGTGEEFGAHELRHLCHSTGKMYGDESISRIIPVHASADLNDDTLMPVRFYTEIEYQVGDAESALESALQPGSTEVPPAHESELVIHAGGPLPGSGSVGTDFGLAGVTDELHEAAVPHLVAALDRARQLNASVKLIAQARTGLTRAKAWIELKKAIVQVTAQRPLSSAASASPLSAATSAALRAGVGASALGVAKAALVACLAECRLQDYVAVGRNISCASHAHDGDIAVLQDSLEVCRRLGANEALLGDAAATLQRLVTEVQLDDEMQGIKQLHEQYSDMSQSLVEDDATAYPRFARLTPLPPALAAAMAAAEEAAAAKASKKKKKSKAPQVEEVYGEGDYWPVGQEYEPSLDPAGDTWIEHDYMKEEEDADAAKKPKPKPKPKPKGAADEPEPLPPMPQATPQLVHLRTWKRSIAQLRATAEAAAGNASADSLVGSALELASSSDTSVNEAHAVEIARVTHMERHKGKKKKKGKGKKK